MQQLLTSRTVPEIHNVIPPWRATSRRVRDPPLERGRGRGRGNEGDDGDRERNYTSNYDTTVPSAVKVLMAPYWKKFPFIKFGQICSEAELRFADLPTAFRGKCFSKFLGLCTRRDCRHNHDYNTITADDVTSLCTLLQPGIQKVVEESSGERR